MMALIYDLNAHNSPDRPSSTMPIRDQTLDDRGRPEGTSVFSFRRRFGRLDRGGNPRNVDSPVDPLLLQSCAAGVPPGSCACCSRVWRFNPRRRDPTALRQIASRCADEHRAFRVTHGAGSSPAAEDHPKHIGLPRGCLDDLLRLLSGPEDQIEHPGRTEFRSIF